MAKYSIWRHHADGKYEVCQWRNRQPIILSRHADRDAAQDEIARLVEDDQWCASNRD